MGKLNLKIPLPPSFSRWFVGIATGTPRATSVTQISRATRPEYADDTRLSVSKQKQSVEALFTRIFRSERSTSSNVSFLTWTTPCSSAISSSHGALRHRRHRGKARAGRCHARDQPNEDDCSLEQMSKLIQSLAIITHSFPHPEKGVSKQAGKT